MEMSATVTDTTGSAKTLSDPVASSHGPGDHKAQAMTEETKASVLPGDIDIPGPECGPRGQSAFTRPASSRAARRVADEEQALIW
jgi:hypothetical protein